MKILVNIVKVFILAVATVSSCSLYANESAHEAQTEWQRALDAYSAKEYDEAKAAEEAALQAHIDEQKLLDAEKAEKTRQLKEEKERAKAEKKAKK